MPTKPDPFVEVSSREYDCAATRWNAYKGLIGESKSFNSLLGTKYGPMVSSVNDCQKAGHMLYVRASAARKIRLLAGPHYWAVLKAYQHRKTPKKQPK